MHVGFSQDKKSVCDELRGVAHAYVLFLVKVEQK